MLQTAHPLRATMDANKPAFGAWLALPGSVLARTIALAHPAISWLCIDAEHGLIGLGGSTIFETCTALSALPGGGPSPIVRIPATAESDSVGWQIKLALDGGARGILVPMCPDAKAAERVAKAARFPNAQVPGIRGLGNPATHTVWGGEGVTMRHYLDSASESVVVMVQIETVEGMNNVEEIAAVPGVDVLFIGPFDLSIAHGYAPPSPDPVPEVEVLLAKIRDAAHKHGKKVAIFCTSGEQAAKRAAEGFDIMNVTSDTGSLTDGISKHLTAASGFDPSAAGAKMRY